MFSAAVCRDPGNAPYAITFPEKRFHVHFLWGCTFFLKKVDDFLVVAFKTQAETAKLTTPTLQISPSKNSVKNWTLALPGRCINNFLL